MMVTVPVRTPLAGDVPLAHQLDALTQKGELYERWPDNKVRCYACGHHCMINMGGRGICQVRFNQAGDLYVPWGYVAALNCDPTEKKPFFHVYPGSQTLTFGMLGCNLHCSFCQNWDISQTLRDAEAGHAPTPVTPEAIVQIAQQQGAKCIASSYNEPLITSEWAAAIFQQSRAAGLTNLFVSSGNLTPDVLAYLQPHLDGYKIDLKTMRAKSYRKLGTALDHVLDGIRMVHAAGLWTEIVTLVIPGFNDSDEELRDAAQFIYSVSPDIPWHVTAFHPDYRMTDPAPTDVDTLMRAVEIGYHAGLHYVYAGNRPGRVGPYEDTRCPNCQMTLVKRRGYWILDNQITLDSTCPRCQAIIAGRWSSK